MRHFSRPTPGSQAWQDWLAEATTARNEVISEFNATGKPDIKNRADIYKKARVFLKELFGDKCAYCESPYAASSIVDVEHYRPKLRVTDENDKIVKTRKGNAHENHPGYYWLAFDWDNLLLSCQNCNRYTGKKNKFPVADESKRAATPADDITKEEPLVLNPFTHDPELHIDFDQPSGFVTWRNNSRLGKLAVENIFDLNRGALTRARASVLRDIKTQVSILVTAQIDNDIEAVKAQIKAIKLRWETVEPYSALWIAKTRKLIETAEQYITDSSNP